MIREIFQDIFSHSSSFGEKIMAITTLFAGILIIGLVLITLFHLPKLLGFNKIKNTVKTKVQKKTVTPARYSLTYSYLGTEIAPMTVFCPEGYILSFEIENNECYLVVNEKTFDQFQVGEIVEVDYSIDWVDKSIQPLDVRKTTKS